MLIMEFEGLSFLSYCSSLICSHLAPADSSEYGPVEFDIVDGVIEVDHGGLELCLVAGLRVHRLVLLYTRPDALLLEW